MVVAHLRGLLSHSHGFGSRSKATEDVILEAIGAEALATSMEVNSRLDLALIPALTQKGVLDTVERVSSRMGRVAELRMMDVYRVADQIAAEKKLTNDKHELSLFQLYHLAEKSGIFDAFDAYYTPDKFTPLL